MDQRKFKVEVARIKQSIQLIQNSLLIIEELLSGGSSNLDFSKIKEPYRCPDCGISSVIRKGNHFICQTCGSDHYK